MRLGSGSETATGFKLEAAMTAGPCNSMPFIMSVMAATVTVRAAGEAPAP